MCKKYSSTDLVVFIRTLISLPNFWVSVVIIIFAMISIIISNILYVNNYIFSSSVLSNIFAGLITGFIITLLSGIRNTYIAILKGKKTWLIKIYKLICNFINKSPHLILLIAHTDKELLDQANEVVDIAIQIHRNIFLDSIKWLNTSKYFKTKLQYNNQIEDELLPLLVYSGSTNKFYFNPLSDKRLFFNKIMLISDILMQSTYLIMDDIESISIKLNVIAKSII